MQIAERETGAVTVLDLSGKDYSMAKGTPSSRTSCTACCTRAKKMCC